MAEKLCILFICTGNTCRSVMAQGLLGKIWCSLNSEGDVEIESAGVGAWEGLSATAETLQVLKEEGVDLQAHRSQAVDREKVAKAHYIFTMTRRHREMLLHRFPGAAGKVWVLQEFVCRKGDKDIADPYGSSMANYRLVAAELKDTLKEVAKKLKAQAQKKI